MLEKSQKYSQLIAVIIQFVDFCVNRATKKNIPPFRTVYPKHSAICRKGVKNELVNVVKGVFSNRSGFACCWVFIKSNRACVSFTVRRKDVHKLV